MVLNRICVAGRRVDAILTALSPVQHLHPLIHLLAHVPQIHYLAVPSKSDPIALLVRIPSAMQSNLARMSVAGKGDRQFRACCLCACPCPPIYTGASQKATVPPVCSGI